MRVSRFGLDPEVAIVSKKTGAGRSAHQFIGDRTEQFRFYVDGREGQGGGMLGSEVSRDGPALEFRSLVASACRDNIIPYMAEALRQMQLELNGWNGGRYKMSTTPLFVLDKRSFTGDVPENVSEFGCNPDYSAYDLDVKSPELESTDMRRYTGGHIHASQMGAKGDIQQQASIAILFDYFVSLPMVAILGEKFAAGEAERRNFYGQPGSFRYEDKIDKIEFRTLSGRVLLSPIILYWAMGAVKSFLAGVPGEAYIPKGTDYKQFLLSIADKLSPDTVKRVVQEHDVEAAVDISRTVFQLLPNYKREERALANPMSGGGGGTTNPYFYEQALQVFIEGNREGVQWDDDLELNWGLYENYKPTHHKYWGVQQAMVGLCDETIFPYRAVLDKVMPVSVLQKTPIWTHPLNGGEGRYVTKSAVHWLA